MKKSKIFFVFWISLLLGVFTSCNKNILVEKPQKQELEIMTKSVLVYSWGSVTTGGGGYVTGIVIHPTTADRMYIRTDVGGAYRWESATSGWIPILEGLSTGNGAEGIAIDKNYPDRVYVALSDGVYRSNDRGANWAKLLSTTYSPNSDLRWDGECLSVDPNNSSVIYAGTHGNGLYRSLDGGTSWAQITSLPTTSNVRSVAINPNVIANGRSSKVYIGIPGTGVYKSTDGGDIFAVESGAPASPNRMIFVDKLYVSHATGLAKYGDGVWTDLTPSAGLNKYYCGITVDPTNPLKMAVCQWSKTFNNPFFRSSNGGTSWEQINTTTFPIVKHLEAPWWPSSWFSSATACLAFDPLHSGNLYYTDWFGIWNTTNLWTNPIDFYTREKGHEETVVLTLAAPPSGALVYSGVCDVFGFRHDALGTFPTKQLYGIQEGFSIAYCESSPLNIAILGSSGNDGTGTILRTSADKGETWTTRALPSGAKLGRIAICATDANKMVYINGTSTGAVYYSTNKGSSWTVATGAPTGTVNAVDVWSKSFPLASDCVDNRFYIFKAGFLYASTDGGATWTKKNSTAIPGANSFLNIVPKPETTGEIWVSLDDNGLYKTTNGGVNFSQVNTSLTASKVFAWGKASGSTIPTAFCYGTLSGVVGMYRSVDSGTSWDEIANGQKFPTGVKALAADRQTFGRVFVGTGGRGVLYGQP